jgi:glutathione S-transferase
MKLFVTPASPWVRRVRVCILELGIQDQFEYVQTRWPHSWGTQTVALAPEFAAATPVARIPALVTDEVALTDSNAIIDYLDEKFGAHRLLATSGPARWRALATIALSSGVIEAQIMRRAESLRSDKDRSADFMNKMRDRSLRCFVALEQKLPEFGEAFDLAQITTAVACSYEDWRYGRDWRASAPKLAAWSDKVAQRPSMKATEPAETPQR